jgi:hypothetical protein
MDFIVLNNVSLSNLADVCTTLKRSRHVFLELCRQLGIIKSLIRQIRMPATGRCTQKIILSVRFSFGVTGFIVSHRRERQQLGLVNGIITIVNIVDLHAKRLHLGKSWR